MESVESRGMVEESQQARMSTDILGWAPSGGARWTAESQSVSREDAVPVLPWTVDPSNTHFRVSVRRTEREKRVDEMGWIVTDTLLPKNQVNFLLSLIVLHNSDIIQLSAFGHLVCARELDRAWSIPLPIRGGFLACL